MKLSEFDRVKGRYRLRVPIEQGKDWSVGDVVEVQDRRKRIVPLRLVDWYPTEEGLHDEWRGREEWVYWFEVARVEERPRLLVPAGRPTTWGPESDIGYTDQRSKSMYDEPEAVDEEWQEAISNGAGALAEKERTDRQRERENRPFDTRLGHVKDEARIRGAGRITRAEIRTIEILGRNQRKRATKLLTKLERRLFR